MRTAVPGASREYSYGGVAYADPDAVTQIANGLSTTTFVYDNNGNVTQKTVDGTTTTYVYDYANRLTALGVLGATTTYAYDWAGNRVSHTSTSTTFIYPFKWYSVASSTGNGAKYATTTDYVLNGDSLVATVDQQTASGNATGTAKTRYVHSDHLGSTNVVTDENDNVVQTLDFYPYGATRISSATSTNERRKFIGQFADDSTFSYFNARYYNSNQGQFILEDPVFLALGSHSAEQLAQQKIQAILADPQKLNPYSYAEDNPISIKDPSGLYNQTAISYANAVAPLLTQLVIVLGKIAALTGGGGAFGNPVPVSTSLIARSATTLSPSSLIITSGNQSNYGNVINKIQQLSDFNTYVEGQIKKHGQDGNLNVPADDPNFSFAFRTGDLHTAFDKVTGGLSGKQSADGTWNLHVTISDVYNFERNSYGGGFSGNAVTALNNAAVVGQQAGVISTYPININLDYTYNPHQ
jgi:RHS repeat-associated protein